MPQQTVLESFWEPLPSLSISPLPNNATYCTIQASAQSTVGMDAPKAFMLENASILLQVAGNRLPANVSSLQERMPRVEKSHLLHTESDVIRASIQYLLHPINVATSRLNSKTLECYVGAISKMWCRTNTMQKQMVDSAYGTHPHYTHFTNNAVWLSKQARKYAQNTGAPDVAIFDWDKMFIFNFYGMAEHLQNPVLAKGIWFEEGNSSQQGHTFRMILFGFLVRALQRQGIIT
ncbi:hypothetical protein GX48_03227 [Paracoccidioides brasiliensis]|nr:hypothetical protein GX48_03227 [Paracoccidioides brasiliensis]